MSTATQYDKRCEQVSRVWKIIRLGMKSLGQTKNNAKHRIIPGSKCLTSYFAIDVIILPRLVYVHTYYKRLQTLGCVNHGVKSENLVCFEKIQPSFHAPFQPNFEHRSPESSSIFIQFPPRVGVRDDQFNCFGFWSEMMRTI